MEYQIINGLAQDVLPGNYEGKVNLIVTSPPYGKLRPYAGNLNAYDFDAIADACVACLAPGGVLVWVISDQVVDGSESGVSFANALAFKERGLRLHQTLVYAKSNVVALSVNRYGMPLEFMFVLSRGAPKTANIIRDRRNRLGGTNHRSYEMGRRGDGKAQAGLVKYIEKMGKRTTIWEYLTGEPHTRRDKYEAIDVHEHPAVFPYGLPADHIRTWSEPGDLVLDPMCGSGTTLLAARDLGRRVVGVEVNPDYVALAHRRLAQPTLIGATDEMFTNANE